MAFPSEHDRFLYTMRAVSGGIAGSGLIVFAVGALGLIRPVLRAISPITVAVNIAVLVSSVVEICWGLVSQVLTTDPLAIRSNYNTASPHPPASPPFAPPLPPLCRAEPRARVDRLFGRHGVPPPRLRRDLPSHPLLAVHARRRDPIGPRAPLAGV